MERSSESSRRWVSAEIAGEIILLTIVGGFFVYLFVESLDWPLGAALMPRIAVAVGTPFWIARVVALVRRAAAKQGRIMDIGFRIGEDPRAEALRFVRIVSFIVGLYLAIWVFGFHVALPLGMFFYLFVYGRVGWVWSVLISLFFLAFIIGVYDRVLHATWHEPLIFEMWKTIK